MRWEETEEGEMETEKENKMILDICVANYKLMKLADSTTDVFLYYVWNHTRHESLDIRNPFFTYF